MQKEIWLIISEDSDIYQISSKGRVKSLKCNKTKILKNSERSDGRSYIKLKLSDTSKRKHYFIHQLVAKAFINNPDKYQEVLHRDGNRKNNKVENLCWMSHFNIENYMINKGYKKIYYGEEQWANNIKSIMDTKDKQIERLKSVLLSKGITF